MSQRLTMTNANQKNGNSRGNTINMGSLCETKKYIARDNLRGRNMGIYQSHWLRQTSGIEDVVERTAIMK